MLLGIFSYLFKVLPGLFYYLFKVLLGMIQESVTTIMEQRGKEIIRYKLFIIAVFTCQQLVKLASSALYGQ